MRGVYIRAGMEPQPWGPLPVGHWLIGYSCPVCGGTFVAGSTGVLEPCAEPEGGNVEAAPVHTGCAGITTY